MKRRDFLRGIVGGGAVMALPSEVGCLHANQLRNEGGGVVYSRSLPVECEVDVFVAGGGPAGVAAAVAAARGGAKVFLAEATGAFGGAATAAYVPAFACFSDGKRLVVGGIGGEIRHQVSQGVPLTVDWAPLDLEELKRVYDAMVTKAGVRFSFFTNVVDVGVRDGRVEHVVLSSKRGLFVGRSNSIHSRCIATAS